MKKDKKMSPEERKIFRLNRKVADAQRKIKALESENEVLWDSLNLISRAHNKSVNALASIDNDGKLFNLWTQKKPECAGL